MAPKTAPKLSTSPLKLKTNGVYAVRLKRMPCPPRPWQPHFPTLPPRPHTQPTLLEHDSLVVLRPQVVVASPSPRLLPAASGDVSISGVMFFLSKNF